MAARREREIARHTATKQRLEDQYKERSSTVLSGEGLSKAVITILIGVLAVILGFIFAPEPLITKAIAAIITIGVSVFAVYWIIKILTTKSGEDLRTEQDSYNEKEEVEDDRHDKALLAIGNC